MRLMIRLAPDGLRLTYSLVVCHTNKEGEDKRPGGCLMPLLPALIPFFIGPLRETIGKSALLRNLFKNSFERAATWLEPIHTPCTS